MSYLFPRYLKVFAPILFFLFLGCECVQRAEGIILEQDSKEPIGNVLFFREEITIKKDSSGANGEFVYGSGIESCIPKPPPVTLCFYKEGYEPVKITREQWAVHDTVFLKKLK